MKHMMNSPKIQQDYFIWLCKQIKVDTQGSEGRRSYWLLADQLSKKEFRWTVPNDDNREADGRALREKWMLEVDIEVDGIDVFPVSVLEVLYALALRINFEMAELDDIDNSVKWFWLLIDNLALSNYPDLVYAEDNKVGKHVDHMLDKWLDRHYDKHGNGGLFPLKHSKKDQRKVELWYQKSEYLMENYA